MKGIQLIGIDVRPADGMLYGVTADGQVGTLDPKTGVFTKKADLSEKLKAGVTATIDFNPAADRLRIMGSDGTRGYAAAELLAGPQESSLVRKGGGATTAMKRMCYSLRMADVIVVRRGREEDTKCVREGGRWNKRDGRAGCRERW